MRQLARARQPIVLSRQGGAPPPSVRAPQPTIIAQVVDALAWTGTGLAIALAAHAAPPAAAPPARPAVCMAQAEEPAAYGGAVLTGAVRAAPPAAPPSARPPAPQIAAAEAAAADPAPPIVLTARAAPGAAPRARVAPQIAAAEPPAPEPGAVLSLAPRPLVSYPRARPPLQLVSAEPPPPYPGDVLLLAPRPLVSYPRARPRVELVQAEPPAPYPGEALILAPRPLVVYPQPAVRVQLIQAEELAPEPGAVIALVPRVPPPPLVGPGACGRDLCLPLFNVGGGPYSGGGSVTVWLRQQGGTPYPAATVQPIGTGPAWVRVIFSADDLATPGWLLIAATAPGAFPSFAVWWCGPEGFPRAGQTWYSLPFTLVTSGGLVWEQIFPTGLGDSPGYSPPRPNAPEPQPPVQVAILTDDYGAFRSPAGVVQNVGNGWWEILPASSDTATAGDLAIAASLSYPPFSAAFAGSFRLTGTCLPPCPPAFGAVRYGSVVSVPCGPGGSPFSIDPERTQELRQGDCGCP